LTNERIGKVETKGFENVFLVEIPLEKRVKGMTDQKHVLFLGIWDDHCNRFALIKRLQSTKARKKQRKREEAVDQTLAFSCVVVEIEIGSTRHTKRRKKGCFSIEGSHMARARPDHDKHTVCNAIQRAYRF